MKKKKRNIIIFIILLIFIIIFAVKFFQGLSKEKISVEDFSSVKELVEYDGHIYIKEEKSKENDYLKDIYIKFSKMPINENGTTNKNLYEILIKHVASKLIGKNFRLIDQEKNIIIRIKFENEKINYYTINNDSKYWEHIESKYQIENVNTINNINFKITSVLLQNIINNNYKISSINLGSKESSIDNYDIYFDEGYKIRKIDSKLYNIIFTTNYKNTIIDNITSNTEQNEIISILGQPHYIDEESNIIGYKGNEIYIFFNESEVSIYPVNKYDESKSKQFGMLVSDLNKTGDMNTFLNKLTDLYPDYAEFYRSNNYINIAYPLRGFKVIMGARQNNGITLYNNFNGYITDEITIDNLKQEKIIPPNVYTKLDNDLVFDTEVTRILQDDGNRLPYDYMVEIKTNQYSVLKSENIYKFYSKDKTTLDSELEIKNVTNMINITDYEFIYGIKNKGIYKYNALNATITTIVEGNENFNIEKIENNTIYYDNKSIQI